MAIYIIDALPESKIKQESNQLKFLSLEITQKNTRPFCFVRWYRSPTSGVDSTAFKNLRESLLDFDKEVKGLMPVDDTNCVLKNSANANTKALKIVYSE